MFRAPSSHWSGHGRWSILRRLIVPAHKRHDFYACSHEELIMYRAGRSALFSRVRSPSRRPVARTTVSAGGIPRESTVVASWPGRPPDHGRLHEAGPCIGSGREDRGRGRGDRRLERDLPAGEGGALRRPLRRLRSHRRANPDELRRRRPQCLYRARRRVHRQRPCRHAGPRFVVRLRPDRHRGGERGWAQGRILRERPAP